MFSVDNADYLSCTTAVGEAQVISIGGGSVEARFNAVRHVLSDIVVDPAHSNRCAAVIGGVLRLHPSGHQKTFAESPDVKPEFRNQVFVKKYFLKASELAAAVEKRYGKPEKLLRGENKLQELQKLPPGIVYLEHCWPTGREKIANILENAGKGNFQNMRLGSAQTGDHMDIWLGDYLAIEGRGVLALVIRSSSIRYWQLT